MGAVLLVAALWKTRGNQLCRNRLDLIIITLKGAIRGYLQSPHCAANCLQHVRSSGPGIIVCKSRATHRALITSNLQCATWYEGTIKFDRAIKFDTAIKFDRVEIAFI